MKAAFQRKLESGAEYDYLFPQANGNEKTIKWDANVYDTLDFIPKIVYETLSHTKALSKLLKGESVYETCNNIWDFVYNHIQYHHDKEGTEQVRSPARSWMDRIRGVDCDCYTVFVSSILTNLHIPHTYRITKYHNKDYYQHIYPIVPLTDGSYITIDAVVNKFNHEEPFTYKKDTPMNLTYLNGIDAEEENQLMAIMPINDLTKLPDFQDFDGLGKIKIGGILKTIAHAANKANPAAVLLRLGVLASMKLNLFQIPKNLRYAYLTDAQVKEQNLDEHKIEKLRKIKTKLEAIFFGAGGEAKNLKKAMLTGRGNKDHSVSGTDDFDINTPLRELLSGVYDDEFTESEREVHGLGDPATGTAIAAATTVLAAIAAVIKSVGSIKKGGAATTAADGSALPADNSGSGTSADDEANALPSSNVRKKATDLAKTGDTTPTIIDTTDDTAQKPTGMGAMKAWVKEHPVKTTVIGVAAISIVAFGVFEIHKHRHHKVAVSGVPHNRKKKRGKKHKKTAIALL